MVDKQKVGKENLFKTQNSLTILSSLECVHCINHAILHNLYTCIHTNIYRHSTQVNLLSLMLFLLTVKHAQYTPKLKA